MDPEEKFLTRSDLLKGHIDSLVTVATAVLVLSITLLKEAGQKNPEHLWSLRGSWIALAGSILSGIIHNTVLMHLIEYPDCWSVEWCKHKKIMVPAMVAVHLLFVAAIFLFLYFAWANVK